MHGSLSRRVGLNRCRPESRPCDWDLVIRHLSRSCEPTASLHFQIDAVTARRALDRVWHVVEPKPFLGRYDDRLDNRQGKR